MILKFTVKLQDSDYLYLKNLDLIDQVVWTHIDTIYWLDSLNYYYEYMEEYVEELAEWWIVLAWTIDLHTLDFILLKNPRLFETRASYEQVELIKD